LIQAHLAAGRRLTDDADPAGALVWIAEALKLARRDGRPEETARVQAAAALRECPRLLQLWAHRGGVRDAEFSPDGRRVVTASLDGTAREWDPATGRPLVPAMQHSDPVWFAAFSPDGRCLVTTSGRVGSDRSGWARLWDPETGRPITPPLAGFSR